MGRLQLPAAVDEDRDLLASGGAAEDADVGRADHEVDVDGGGVEPRAVGVVVDADAVCLADRDVATRALVGVGLAAFSSTSVWKKAVSSAPIRPSPSTSATSPSREAPSSRAA